MTARNLSGRSVLVVGATGELGKRVASELAKRGARLTLAGRSAERLAGVAESLGGSAVVSVLDFRTPGTEAQAVAAALEAYGRLDGVVNAAGTVAFGPLAETPDDVIDTLVGTNFTGPLRLARAAIPHLPDDGFLVNISAIVADMPTANMAAYSATKAALTAADRALAKELRRSGVSVIDVRPPHTETGLAERPIAGTAPRLPEGLDPDSVAARLVVAIEGGERDVPPDSFNA